MKIISLHTNTDLNEEQKWIQKAIKNDRKSQKQIYDKYAPKMLSICRYYVQDIQFAEDILLKGFFKVFEQLKSFEHKGSFEGWIRRIMVREAIDFLRKKNMLVFKDEIETHFSAPQITSIEIDETKYIQNIIDELPSGYKTVFNLYVMEGYSHKEIASTLNIKESTSRSQLTQARKIIKNELREQHGISWK